MDQILWSFFLHSEEHRRLIDSLNKENRLDGYSLDFPYYVQARLAQVEQNTQLNVITDDEENGLCLVGHHPSRTALDLSFLQYLKRYPTADEIFSVYYQIMVTYMSNKDRLPNFAMPQLSEVRDVLLEIRGF